MAVNFLHLECFFQTKRVMDGFYHRAMSKVNDIWMCRQDLLGTEELAATVRLR